jgi:hypothetical protein
MKKSEFCNEIGTAMKKALKAHPLASKNFQIDKILFRCGSLFVASNFRGGDQ